MNFNDIAPIFGVRGPGRIPAPVVPIRRNVLQGGVGGLVAAINRWSHINAWPYPEIRQPPYGPPSGQFVSPPRGATVFRVSRPTAPVGDNTLPIFEMNFNYGEGGRPQINGDLLAQITNDVLLSTLLAAFRFFQQHRVVDGETFQLTDRVAVQYVIAADRHQTGERRISIVTPRVFELATIPQCLEAATALTPLILDVLLDAHGSGIFRQLQENAPMLSANLTVELRGRFVAPPPPELYEGSDGGYDNDDREHLEVVDIAQVRRQRQRRLQALAHHRYNTRSQVYRTRSGRHYGRVMGRQYVGATTDALFGKMFFKAKLESFFVTKKALYYIPELTIRWCFPMAFMRCQLREYRIDDIFKDLKEVVETKASAKCADFATKHGGRYIVPRVFPIVDGRSELHDDGMLAVFNPYKRPVGDRFENCATEDEGWNWVNLAIELHAFVEQQLNREVNLNSLHEVANAYAEVFQTHIHIYDLTQGSERTGTFYPKAHFVADDIMEQRHIHMLLMGEHLHAVSNVREFMCQTKEMSLHNYCDYCGWTSHSSMNKTEAFKHLNKCLKDNKQCMNQRLSAFTSRIQKELKGKQRFTYSPCRQTQTNLQQCLCCRQKMVPEETGFHACLTKAPQVKDLHPEDKLWVYDVESMNRALQSGEFEHVVDLVCAKRMYEQEKGESNKEFTNIPDFVQWLITDPALDDSVFLAHNGGSYDHQFVLREAERLGMEYDIIPHPNSPHKYLCLSLYRMEDGKRLERRFLDFIAFCPGSLKGIGKAYNLQVTKGDFPHRFHEEANMFYEGALPPLEYYDPGRCRSDEDHAELIAWYEEEKTKYCECFEDPVCTCNKPPWKLREELVRYCWLDVEVLAQCTKLFRESMLYQEDDEVVCDWKYTPIDPYTCFTQSQIAISLIMNGSTNPEVQLASSQYYPRCFSGPEAVTWMMYLERTEKITIQHAGRSLNEWYCNYRDVQKPFTGLDRTNRTVYEMRDCAKEACPHCYSREKYATNKEYEDYKDPHSCRTRLDIVSDQIKRSTALNKCRYALVVMYVCEYKREILPHTTAYEQQCGKVIEDREFFFGGRTEVFAPYAKAECRDTNYLTYNDVCSLYPYICAFKELPITHPHLIFAHAIDRDRLQPTHRTPYWGFVKCKVIPNKKDRLGLLPSRDAESGRLEYNLYDKIGTWHTEELHLAMAHGYQIEEIYQVYHWNPNERSSTYLRGYMSHFLRMKQEAEGWKKAGASSETPSPEEQERVIEELFQANGGIARMRPDKVRKNPVLRFVAKIFLNCAWGKYCQFMSDEVTIDIHGCFQYNQLVNHPAIDSQSIEFRHVQGNWFKAYLKKHAEYANRNCRYNIFLGACVPMWGRTTLNVKMLEIGPEYIVYCDTDSIICRYHTSRPRIGEKGLGKFVDEYPDAVIEEVYALAPKSYYLGFAEKSPCIKMKGISLTRDNSEKVTRSEVRRMIEENWLKKEPTPLMLNHFSIFCNSQRRDLPYATMMSRYNQKKLQTVYSKRKLQEVEAGQFSLDDMEYLCLFPKGYEE